MTSIDRAEASLIRYRLDRPVGGSGVAAIDVVVVELTDSDGAQSLGFTYAVGGIGGEVVLAAARVQIQSFVLNQPLPPPPALWRKVAGSFNRTG